MPDLATQAAFPSAHIAQRLEQTAAGLWPEQAPAVDDDDAVSSTLLKVRLHIASFTFRKTLFAH